MPVPIKGRQRPSSTLAKITNVSPEVFLGCISRSMATIANAMTMNKKSMPERTSSHRIFNRFVFHPFLHDSATRLLRRPTPKPGRTAKGYQYGRIARPKSQPTAGIRR